LQPGEQKSLQTDRVVLVPGPTEERAVVRRIYRSFVHDGRTEGERAVATIVSAADAPVVTDVLGQPPPARPHSFEPLAAGSPRDAEALGDCGLGQPGSSL
jgi:hypothetical protein